MQPGIARSFSSYHATVSASIAQVNVRPWQSGPFRSRIAAQHIGDIQFVEVRSDAVSIDRSSECIAVDGRNHYFLPIVRSGKCMMKQRDRQCELSERTLTLLDTTEPHQARFPQPAVRLVTCIARPALDRRLRQAEALLGQVIDAKTGMGSIANGYLLNLFSEWESLDSQSRLATSDVGLDLIALALRSSLSRGVELRADATRLKHDALLVRITRHIRDHLYDPTLSPAVLASRHGISLRYLHRLFEATGTGIAGWIREERLKRCYNDLTAPEHKHRTITEIALSAGFNDAAHFSRLFTAAYGMTARELRRRVE